MTRSVSPIFHDVNRTSSMSLNNAAFCRLLGHLEGRIQTSTMELLLHCELVRADICQNPTTRVANRITRIGDTLAIGTRTHNNLVMPALYNGCVRNTPIMLICNVWRKQRAKAVLQSSKLVLTLLQMPSHRQKRHLRCFHPR